MNTQEGNRRRALLSDSPPLGLPEVPAGAESVLQCSGHVWDLQREHWLGTVAQEGKSKVKMYNKQKICFAHQGQFDRVNDADLYSLDARRVAFTTKATATWRLN